MDSVYTANTSKKDFTIYILLLSSLIITLFLFFIDEGYYNFKWIYNPGNWIVFFIYFTGIFGGQILFSKVIFRKLNNPFNAILSIIFGSILSLSILILGFLGMI